MNPDTPQAQPFFGQKISRTGINVNQATDNQLVTKTDYNTGTTIYYDNAGIPNVLIGLRSLTNIRGFYVAQSGIDVTQATNQQLVFNSEQSFTVAISGQVTFPEKSVATGSDDWATSVPIPHGVGFIPEVGCYAPLQVGGASLPVYPPDFPATLTTFMGNGSLVYQEDLAYMGVYYGVDATNLWMGLSYINDSGSTLTLLGVTVTYVVYTYNIG
jgi:hypothetical protein